jgi:broad specificity phosphatase PhoE
MKRRQGRVDSPLTALGVTQAKACGLVLRKEISDLSEAVLYTSPLGRARTTAEIIRACLDLPPDRVVVEECLAEHDYGEWQGLTNDQVDALYPGLRAQRERDKWNYVVPGGESYAILERRLLPWMTSHREATTAIAVVHDMVSRVLRGIYLALEPSQTLVLDHPHSRIYKLSNGDVSVLDAQAHCSQ